MADVELPLAGPKATVPEAIALNDLSLIGVITGRGDGLALLRSSRGQIARVTTGDAVFGVTVTAIGEDMVITTDRWGRTRSLSIPTG